MKQIVLVDGKNLVFRVHYVHRLLATKDGKPTSVLFGVLSSLLNMAKRLPEAQWAFVWDGIGRTWRHDLLDEVVVKEVMPIDQKQRVNTTGGHRAETSDWFSQQMNRSVQFLNKQTVKKKPIGDWAEQGLPRTHPARQVKPSGYKAHRAEMNAMADHQLALAQIPELKNVLSKIGIRQFEVQNLEGDDLVGILVKQLAAVYDDVIIHSGDRDFYQFIGEGVRQLKGIRNGELYWASTEEIWNEFRITVADWVKLKALIGDSSDNIPHLFDRVGQVTAAGWLREGLDPSLEKFGSHEPSVQRKFTNLVVRKNVIELAARWPEVYRNYRLCRILTDPMAQEFKHCREELKKQLVGLTPEKLRRRPTPDFHRWLSEWLVRYEMAELYGRRQEFLQIP